MLASLGHTWWIDGSAGLTRDMRGAISFDNALSFVEVYIREKNRQQFLSLELDKLIGMPLDEWLLKGFASWHSQGFFKRPLIQHIRTASQDRGVFVHSWDQQLSGSLHRDIRSVVNS
jgi:hypothetical protein